MPHTNDPMTITDMREWAEQVSLYDKVRVAQAWHDLLLHKRHITMRRTA
jgi:hypothetical protein